MPRLLLIPAIISASFVILIIMFVIQKGASPFLFSSYGDQKVSFIRFMMGQTWFIPPNEYGILYIVINTVYVVSLAAIISSPIAFFSGLFIAKIVPKIFKNLFQTVVELLAAIPSIIYGVFGLGVITKFVVRIASLGGIQTAGGISGMATVLVLAVMIYPTITLMSVTAINTVDHDLEKASLALGATKIQTLFKVTLASAKPGIITGIVLGLGRALGEATAVSMVAGNAGSGPVFDLFKTTRTLTSTMLLGIKETSGLDYDIRFSVGVVLIFIIIAFNILLGHFKKKAGRFA
ncbi:MAG: phosphate ABC transporter permease subunit PstC [Candidatus Izemoplasmatales bacterium]